MTDEETEEEVENEQPPAAEVIAAAAPVGAISENTVPPALEQPPPSIIVAPAPQPSQPSRPGILPRLFSGSRKSGLTLTQPNDDTSATLSTSAPASQPSSRSATPSKMKRPKFKRGRGEKGGAYNFGADKDVVGIVLLEVNKAEDLPKLKNSKQFCYWRSYLLIMS